MSLELFEPNPEAPNPVEPNPEEPKPEEPKPVEPKPVEPKPLDSGDFDLTSIFEPNPVPKPSVLGFSEPKPSILEPKPSALEPKPSTLGFSSIAKPSDFDLFSDFSTTALSIEVNPFFTALL